MRTTSGPERVLSCSPLCLLMPTPEDHDALHAQVERVAKEHALATERRYLYGGNDGNA